MMVEACNSYFPLRPARWLPRRLANRYRSAAFELLRDAAAVHPKSSPSESRPCLETVLRKRVG